MVAIGARLREERNRMSASQPAFGVFGGITKKTQSLYETGARAPDAAYLSAIGSAGADILYILTGQRGTPAAEPAATDVAEPAAWYGAEPNNLDSYKAAWAAVEAEFDRRQWHPPRPMGDALVMALQSGMTHDALVAVVGMLRDAWGVGEHASPADER
jgi:transcriptional regulator with XRE-family HTH domain